MTSPAIAGPGVAVAARARDLTKVYGTGDTAVTALDGVSLDFPAKSFTAVMGPSGSGKSTLMHCMAGLDAAKLAEAIRVVHSGDAIVDPPVTRRLLDRFARLPVSPAAAASSVDGLTSRETQVLRLVARGLSNAEIAAELVITETTVKTHVHHLLTKLKARDRVQLVIFAYDAGLASAS